MLFDLMDKQDEVVNAVANTKTDIVKAATTNTGLKVFNLLNERELAQAELFLKKVIASDKGGIKSVN